MLAARSARRHADLDRRAREPADPDPGPVGGARADLRDAALRGARLAARARRAEPGPADPARHPAARAVGEPAWQRAPRLRARAAALRRRRGVAAAHAQPPRPLAPARALVRRPARAARLALRAGLVSTTTGHGHQRRVPRDGHRVGGHDACAAWPAFFLFAALAIVAILRPEIQLGLFDCLCLVRSCWPASTRCATSSGSRSPPSSCCRPGSPRWSPESPVALAPAPAPHAARARRRDRGRRARRRPHDREARAPVARRPRAPRSRSAAAADPSLRVVTRGGLRGLAAVALPALRGKIAFDIRFELLGARGLKDVARIEEAAGPTLEPAVRAATASTLWNRAAKPELVGSLLAEPRRARALAPRRRVRDPPRPARTPPRPRPGEVGTPVPRGFAVIPCRGSPRLGRRLPARAALRLSS